jgi:hypothetical protein
VLERVAERFNEKISPFDIQCVRKIHKIDKKPQFFYKSKFASPQYSLAFVDFLINEVTKLAVNFKPTLLFEGFPVL